MGRIPFVRGRLNTWLDPVTTAQTEPDPPVRSGPAARHADDPAVGPARHLGPTRGMPALAESRRRPSSAVLLVGVLAFGGYWVFRLQGNITKAPLSAGSDKTEGAVNDSTGRMQILILGSDTRDGKNSQYGTVRRRHRLRASPMS